MAHEYEGNMANEFDSFDDSQISDREVELITEMIAAYQNHMDRCGDILTRERVALLKKVLRVIA
jgi:hypothetical protein